MDRINIRELEVQCIIGTKPVERENAQKVVIDISLDGDFTKAAKSDQLSDTVNYKALTDDICGMVGKSDFFLLERLAEGIADLCLAHDGVFSVRVSAEKPGALLDAKSVGVELVRPKQ